MEQTDMEQTDMEEPDMECMNLDYMDYLLRKYTEMTAESIETLPRTLTEPKEWSKLDLIYGINDFQRFMKRMLLEPDGSEKLPPHATLKLRVFVICLEAARFQLAKRSEDLSWDRSRLVELDKMLGEFGSRFYTIREFLQASDVKLYNISAEIVECMTARSRAGESLMSEDDRTRLIAYEICDPAAKFELLGMSWNI